MLIPVEFCTILGDKMNLAVLLREKNRERFFCFLINPADARNILLAKGLAGKSVSRLPTHKFICNLIEEFGAAIKRVVIHTLKDNQYFADLVVTQYGGEKKINIRPSDCVAIALTCECPIFVEESLMEPFEELFEELKEEAERERENLIWEQFQELDKEDKEIM